MNDLELKKQRLEGGSLSLDKASVDYSKGKGNTICAKCVHYLGEGRCEIVMGKIEEDGWCKLFAAKDSRED